MSVFWLMAVLSARVVSAVIMLSAARVVKVLGAPWPDDDNSGDALRADAALLDAISN